MLLHTDIKLLSLVLGEAIWGVVGVTDDQLDGASIPTIILKVKNGTKHLNLDTLSRLYKEWAFDKHGVIMKSYKTMNAGACETIDKMGICIDTCDDSTEVEAIIKAAEWIAKEKGLL